MNKIALALLLILLPAYAFAQSTQDTSTTTASSTPVMATTTSTTTIPVIQPVPATVIVRNVHNPSEVERLVRATFPDAPVMVDIARCESRFRQFADSGNVMRGGTDNQMIGIFQIYSSVHRATAVSLGMDIDTVEGNIRYARYLYDRQRTSPWMDSMPCWNTNPVTEVSSNPVPADSRLTASLTFGMVHPEVMIVQKILNMNGFQVSASGAGSRGNETTSFGSLTRAAVRAFQCAKNIVCGGDEYTTSYGTVGPRTREALMRMAADALAGNPTPIPAPNPSPVIVPAPDQNAAAEAARIATIRAQIAQLQAQIQQLQAQIPQ